MPRGSPKYGLPAEVVKRTRVTHNHMVARCTNPKHVKFLSYGAKGIQVCRRWLEFGNFLADMGPRPEGKTLDRFPDRGGNYEPGNCRWATSAEQHANRTVPGGAHVLLGEQITIREAARRAGVSETTIHKRMKKDGLTLQEAVDLQANVGRKASLKTLSALVESLALTTDALEALVPNDVKHKGAAVAEIAAMSRAAIAAAQQPATQAK